MVSTFSNPDNELLQSSYQTLHVCKYQGDQALQVIEVDNICSVVAMIPFDQPLDTDAISQIGQRHFVLEKFGLDMDHTRENQEVNIE